LNRKQSFLRNPALIGGSVGVLLGGALILFLGITTLLSIVAALLICTSIGVLCGVGKFFFIGKKEEKDLPAQRPKNFVSGGRLVGRAAYPVGMHFGDSPKDPYAPKKEIPSRRQKKN
jgi:hypothetical protein